MNTIRKYIIVDDDCINNAICSMVIKRTLGEVDTQIFTLPEKALSYIENEYTQGFKPTMIFLDINMPTLTGWEFMEHYEKFSEEIKSQMRIYIVSSSIDQRDKDKAKLNKRINGFISKPLMPGVLLSLEKQFH